MIRVESRTSRGMRIANAVAVAGAVLMPVVVAPQVAPLQARTYRSNYAMRARRFVTITGTLLRDANNKTFTMRSRTGTIYKVDTRDFVNAHAADKLQKGDSVRVNGRWKNNVFYAKNLRVIVSSAPQLGHRVLYKSRYYTMGQMNTLQGILTTDADDDEFQMRANNGVVYMVLTRTIPDSHGLNKLQKGQRVRVNGYWIPDADGGQPQLEAKSVRVR